MYWNDGHMSGWGYGLMTVGVIVLIVIATTLVILAFSRTSDRRADAESILAERYARGEIDETEYHRRLTELRS